MPEPITRTILERFDVPDSGHETVVMLVEMASQVNSGLHTHGPKGHRFPAAPEPSSNRTATRLLQTM